MANAKEVNSDQPKQGNQKQEKKPKNQAASEQEKPAVDEVWDVYRNCDLRVGKIVECTPHPQSEKLYVEKIDVGETDKIRIIGSGLQQFVPLDQMT